MSIEQPPNKDTNTNPNDSESEDEDYVPDADESSITDNVVSQTSTTQQNIPLLSNTKQRAVDDAFQDLFGKTYHSTSKSKKTNTKKRPKSKKALKKKKNILSEIFGGAGIASKLMASSADVVQIDAKSRQRRGALKGSDKVEVKEQIQFAGQMMEINRTVDKDTHDKNNTSTNTNTSSSKDESTGSGTGSGSSAPKAIGIDAVLSKINGPKKFTTIDKTNVDWETFKDKTGMEEELRKKAEGKDAYLVKKDFLNRVDVRRFEQEKDDRNKKRAAAASSSSK